MSICPHLRYKGCNVHHIFTAVGLPLETVCDTRQMPFKVLVMTLHKRCLALECDAMRTCGLEVALALIDGGLESSVGYEQTFRAFLLC